MATSNREARRRRIIDAGSDRLAFITGQIRKFPSQPPPPSHTSAPSESQLRRDGSDQILPDRASGPHERISNTGILNNSHISNADHDQYRSREEPLQPQMSTETSAEELASESRDTIQPSPSAVTSTPDLGAQQPPSLLWALPKFLTPTLVGTAIDASEYARMFSALAIALLVISSRLGFLLGSIISFRPVIFLILTNATIVLGRVLLNHPEDSPTAARQENGGNMNGHDIADQVGNALETVLMIKKITDAVFMDFSIYAVIVICCLCFL